MARMTEKAARDMMREKYVAMVMEFLGNSGEEILQTKTNEFCFPCVDELGNDQFLRVTIAVPTGSKEDPYDGYSEAEAFAQKQRIKAEKAAETAAKKEAKMARDAEKRAKAAAIHEQK